MAVMASHSGRERGKMFSQAPVVEKSKAEKIVAMVLGAHSSAVLIIVELLVNLGVCGDLHPALGTTKVEE